MKVKHMVMHTWRWLPQMQYTKRLIDEGYLGRIYQAKFRFSFGFLHKQEYAWRIDADRANGALGDMGSHMIDMARFFLGDVARVSASLHSFVEHDGPEGRPLNPANDSALLLLDFVNGAHATIELSIINHLADEGGIAVSLFGENGTLHADLFFDKISYAVRGARREEEAIHPIEVPPEFVGGFKLDDLFAAYKTDAIGPRLFIDCILDAKTVEKTLQVIDAALESQRTGQRITIG
jgi:predicted dehydrogenase